MRSQNDDEQGLALRFAHIALPNDAIDCEPWEWHADAWRRFFAVKDWHVAGVSVGVAGEQTHRGVVTRWIYVGGEDQFTSSGRHRLMQALTDGGELLDHLERGSGGG